MRSLWGCCTDAVYSRACRWAVLPPSSPAGRHNRLHLLERHDRTPLPPDRALDQRHPNHRLPKHPVVTIDDLCTNIETHSTQL